MFSVLTTIFFKKKAIRKPLNQSSVRRDAKEEMDREVDQGDGTRQLTGQWEEWMGQEIASRVGLRRHEGRETSGEGRWTAGSVRAGTMPLVFTVPETQYSLMNTSTLDTLSFRQLQMSSSGLEILVWYPGGRTGWRHGFGSFTIKITSVSKPKDKFSFSSASPSWV